MRRTLILLDITYDDTDPRLDHPRDWKYPILLDLKPNERADVVFVLDKLIVREDGT